MESDELPEEEQTARPEEGGVSFPFSPARLWAARTASEPAEELTSFCDSLEYDRLLARHDIAGSRAHVRSLVRSDLLTEVEGEEILSALDATEDELLSGAFEFLPSDEDIHTAVERRVTELAPAVGGKLHTARSRNDQVACDLRLYLKEALLEVAGALLDLQKVLSDRAASAPDARLPAYTHLQRAQPVLLAHHLLAHCWALARDFERLIQTFDRVDVSPLGAGAAAGTSLGVDPDFTAGELGFSVRFENSLDAVSDRDFVAEALFVLTIIGVHLSRLGEEVVFWCSEEVGFLRLHDAFSTGSSMLPQKKNPDAAELVRARSGRLIGNLTGLLAVLKGLPLSYNRDLQEDKEPLFDSVRQVLGGLKAMMGLFRSAEFNIERMRSAADDPYLAAADLAEMLVKRGERFRDAHRRVAELVRRSLDGDGDFVEMAAASLGQDAADLLREGAALESRSSPGGGGTASVAVQFIRFGERMEADAERLESLLQRG